MSNLWIYYFEAGSESQKVEFKYLFTEPDFIMVEFIRSNARKFSSTSIKRMLFSNSIFQSSLAWLKCWNRAFGFGLLQSAVWITYIMKTCGSYSSAQFRIIFFRICSFRHGVDTKWILKWIQNLWVFFVNEALQKITKNRLEPFLGLGLTAFVSRFWLYSFIFVGIWND